MGFRTISRPHEAKSRPFGGMRRPWGHVSRHCKYCSQVGPRVQVFGGWAHRRCIPKGSADDNVSKACRPLSNSSIEALEAMKEATLAKPVLPMKYVFKRPAADHMVDRGLAHYRTFSKEEGAGGYWLSAAGRDALAAMETWCPFCKRAHVGGDTCLGHHP